jgi:hypothetical protein
MARNAMHQMLSLCNLFLLANILAPSCAIRLPHLSTINSFARGWRKQSQTPQRCDQTRCILTQTSFNLDPAAILLQYRGGRMKGEPDSTMHSLFYYVYL